MGLINSTVLASGLTVMINWKIFAWGFNTKTSFASLVAPLEFFLVVSLVMVNLASILKYCRVAGLASGCRTGIAAIKLFFLSKQMTKAVQRLAETALAKRKSWSFPILPIGNIFIFFSFP